MATDPLVQASRPPGRYPDLHGRRALVTGGTSGIGLAIAEELLDEGMRVVLVGKDRDRGEAAAKVLRARGDVHFVQADLIDEAEGRRAVRHAARQLGGIDALVNSAGAALVARLVETPIEEFDRMWALNVRAVLVAIQEARPHLAERKGVVVNIGSDAGLRGEEGIGAYSVSKAALLMMSRLLALDLARDGVRCTTVSPGATLPGMRHIGHIGSPAEGDDPSGWPETPLGRFGSGADVAHAVSFLLSADSSFCTGTDLLLDGGLQAGVAG